MGTIFLECGCSVSSSMFGNHKIMGVGHCSDHDHLYSENKTIKQMAEEIMKL